MITLPQLHHWYFSPHSFLYSLHSIFHLPTVRNTVLQVDTVHVSFSTCQSIACARATDTLSNSSLPASQPSSALFREMDENFADETLYERFEATLTEIALDLVSTRCELSSMNLLLCPIFSWMEATQHCAGGPGGCCGVLMLPPAHKECVASFQQVPSSQKERVTSWVQSLVRDPE